MNQLKIVKEMIFFAWVDDEEKKQGPDSERLSHSQRSASKKLGKKFV